MNFFIFIIFLSTKTLIVIQRYVKETALTLELGDLGSMLITLP